MKKTENEELERERAPRWTKDNARREDVLKGSAPRAATNTHKV